MKIRIRTAVSRRSGFSLIEVLFAIAIFGAATAALFSAMTPAYEELHRLSNEPATAGDVEVFKSMFEASPNYSAATQGGEVSLPDGRQVAWRATLTPTTTEALFAVMLEATAGDETYRTEYLHFEPRWLQPGTERPRWLQHSASTPNAGGGGTGGGQGRPGGQGQQGGQRGQPGSRDQGGARGQPGGRQGGQGRPGGNGQQGGPGGARGPQGGAPRGGNPGGAR